MPATRDYELLLDLPNVGGVEYDHETETAIAFVTEKVPESELEDRDLVSTHVDTASDVVETGEFWIEIATGPSSELDIGPPPRAISSQSVEDVSAHRSRRRPVRGGVSEGVADQVMAGSGGPYLATVTEPDNGHWSAGVERGDRVRVSNCHVYAGARSDAGQYGDAITQPGLLDADRGRGTVGTVGHLRGYVPLEDGVSVDAAARSVQSSRERPTYEGLSQSAGRRIRREYSDLRGQELTKAGRTTGISAGSVLGTSVSVDVHIDSTRVVRFRDQLLTEDMSAPGDSGSAVFDDRGRLAGLLFAGSQTTTLHNKIPNVESELGVAFVSRTQH